MLHDRDYVNFVFKEIKKTFWKIKGKFKVYQFIAMVKERERKIEREREYSTMMYCLNTLQTDR